MGIKLLFDELEITSVMKPVDEMGGDYYDMMESNGKLWFAIGDVSGHGVTAGLISMMAQSIFTSCLEFCDDAKELMEKINGILTENIRNKIRECYYMTMQIFKYLGGGRFQVCNAGHPNFVVYRSKRNECETYDMTSVFLGVKSNIKDALMTRDISLEKNDVLVMYTDGIVEATDKEKKLYGVTRLMDILKSDAYKPLDSLKASILKTSLDWCDHNQKDDITLVMIKMV